MNDGAKDEVPLHYKKAGYQDPSHHGDLLAVDGRIKLNDDVQNSYREIDKHNRPIGERLPALTANMLDLHRDRAV